MNFRALSTLALIAGIAGCVSTNATVLDPTINLARTCPDAVRLFTTPSKVPSPYREVAVIHSKGSTTWSNEEHMMESMRKKAAKVGANGVILENIDEPSAFSKVIGQVAQTGTVRAGKALAIYIPADSTSGAALCATKVKKS